jgi:hypothetical protein
MEPDRQSGRQFQFGTDYFMSTEAWPLITTGGRLASTLAEGFMMGVLATFCMSIWMLLANRMTPAKQPDPLPPEEITRHLTEKLQSG